MFDLINFNGVFRSDLLIRYSISLADNIAVPGMATTPDLQQPIIVKYHSGIRGNMTKAKSPFLAPVVSSALAN